MVVHVEYNQGSFFFHHWIWSPIAKQVISSLRGKVSSPKYNIYVLQIILILPFLYHWLTVFSFHTHIHEKQPPTNIIKLLEETRAKYIYKKNALFLFNNWLVGKVNDTIRYLAKIQTNTAFGQVADKNVKGQCIAISLSIWNLYLYLAQHSLQLSPTFKANQRKWTRLFLWFLISRPSPWPITFILPSKRKRILDLLIANSQWSSSWSATSLKL